VNQPNPRQPETVVARYVTPGDAIVLVTSWYRTVEADDAYAVGCEACGDVQPDDTCDDTCDDPHRAALDLARLHARTCNRIPERLRTQGGAW
jgi:hypothetical protein